MTTAPLTEPRTIGVPTTGAPAPAATPAVTTGPNALEVIVHLIDGAQVRFVQKDPAAAGRLLALIQPARLFSGSLITIGDRTALTTFPPHRVVRIDLLTDGMPSQNNLPLGVAQVMEVSADDYTNRDRRSATSRFAHIELTNGTSVYLAVAPDLREEADLPPVETTHYDNPAMFLNRIFSGHGLYLQRLGGGNTILNPAHFARLTVHPLPGSLPPDGMPVGIWEASLAAESR